MEDEDIIKAELLSLASLKGFLGLGLLYGVCRSCIWLYMDMDL